MRKEGWKLCKYNKQKTTLTKRPSIKNNKQDNVHKNTFKKYENIEKHKQQTHAHTSGMSSLLQMRQSTSSKSFVSLSDAHSASLTAHTQYISECACARACVIKNYVHV